MEQAYVVLYDDYIVRRRKIELLPKCKRVTELGKTNEYQLVQGKLFFGLFRYTYWLNKKHIEWHDPPTVEYYDCNCGK